MPKVKIFAEAKPKSSFILPENYNGDDEELLKLKQKYLALNLESRTILDERDATLDIIYNLAKTKINDSDYQKQIMSDLIFSTYTAGSQDDFGELSKFFTKEEQKTISGLRKKARKLYKQSRGLSLQKSKIDDVFIRKTKSAEEPDPTFITEGRKLQKFYKSKGIDAEIIPVYGDTTQVRKHLSQITPEDDVIILGHSGSRLGGIDNKWLAKAFKKANPKRCAVGSCEFEKFSEPYKKEGIKNFMYRPATSWWGVDSNAQTLEGAMYNVGMPPTGGGNIGNMTAEQIDSLIKARRPRVMPLEEGKSYIKINKQN